MKGNEPFKTRITELLKNLELTFRWDMLHLCNRAHLVARGQTAYEKKKKEKDLEQGDEPEESDIISSTLLSDLINHIQRDAKKFRTGINYTSLKISVSDFKRPKVWSTTRMCLYEFEMTLRFLQNKLYFEVRSYVSSYVRM